jgi:2,3-bisphosphoglycerate-independent phosphoglycerate mutase
MGKKFKTHAIIVLDGWGIAPVWGGNAITMAKTKTFTELMKQYPSTTLVASDGMVGLPPDKPGNSEAGHINIGAGKMILQDQTTIDNKISDGTFFTNTEILGAIKNAKEHNSSIHLMGLLSKAGTHSYIGHLYSTLELIKNNNFENVYIHLFTDGRDSDSMSGIEMVVEVEDNLKRIGIGKIVSIIGRYYAMDRDNNWERIRSAYEMLVEGAGKSFTSSGQAFTDSYALGVTDEFIPASLIGEDKEKTVTISDKDSIIFFNFRADRTRELTSAFLDDLVEDYPNRKKLSNLYFVDYVSFNGNKKVHQAFQPQSIIDTLAKIWSDHGLRQLHVAETEKYAHVTYFLNGGNEVPHAGESWQMIASPKVATYDLQPAMSAEEVANLVISEIESDNYDGMVVNFANADMVGHTGNLRATVEAVEYVDLCLGKIIPKLLEKDGIAFILADHGNAEQMVNPKTAEPDTEHTSNPVPFIIVGNNPELKTLRLRNDCALSSVAPTVLDIMGIPYDRDQKAKSLINLN